MSRIAAHLINRRLARLLFLIGLLIILAGCAFPLRSQPVPTIAPAVIDQAKATSAQQVPPTQSLPTQPSPTQEPADPASTAEQSAVLLPQAVPDLDLLSAATRYTIDLQIDYPAKAFQGQAQVDFTNTEDVPLDRLYFRLLPNGQKSYGDGSLRVSSASIDGQPVKPRLSLSDTVLELPLAASLEIGDSLRIDLEFAGTVPMEFGGEDEPGGYGIYNYSQGVLALSGWYPILAVYDQDGWNLDPVSVIGDSVYSDTSLYTVDITTDPELLLAATGEEIGQDKLDGEIRRHYVSGPVRDFFLIMSPDFQIVSQEVDGVEVNSYFLPENPQGGEAALEVTAQSLQIYNQYFGEYPFAEIDVVEAPMRYALGVEYPGIFLVASDLYADPAQDNFLVATAHEVAHQWWYSVVGNDVFDEPWLDESLATYSSSLYYQDAISPVAYRAFTSYWKDRLSDLREDSLDDQVTQSLGYFEALDTPRVYGTVVYTKGALFFDALRSEIGDEAFFGALQNYYQKYKYQIAETEDLLAEFEASADRQLDELFQEWLFTAED